MYRSLVFVVSGLCLLANPPAWSEEPVLAKSAANFSVTTRVYSGESAVPSAEHLILFRGDKAYDVPQIERRFVTVVDFGAGRVALLDRDTLTRTTLSSDELVKHTAQVRATAQQPEQRRRLGLLANVKPTQDGYAIAFELATYKTTTQKPENEWIARSFAQFVDTMSRLNIVRGRGLPPFARMTLNQHLAAAGEIPDVLRLKVDGGQVAATYRSTHQLAEPMGEDELGAIDEIDGMLALYDEVPLAEFPE